MKIDKAYCQELSTRPSAAIAVLEAYDDADEIVKAKGRAYAVVLLRHRLHNAFNAYGVEWPWGKPGRKLTQT